ncbi:DUF11 domain-containing protein [bacterium]|nr:DUF11 domain-containing protein [bacterium]
MSLTLMLLLGASAAHATGTPAGTVIQSQATVTYVQDGNARTAVSNRLALPVHEVLDFTLAWADAADVAAYAGDLAVALTFRLQNTGNGRDTFHLTAISALAGDDFDPARAAIHFDSDGNGLFDPVRDDAYDAGVNDPELAADAELTVFLVGDVPVDATPGDRGRLKLAVGSAEGYGTPGTVVHGAGDDGTDAVIGPGGGFAEADGALQLVAAQVRLVKSATVASAVGTSLAPGEADTSSVVTYTIDVTVSGTGTARDVVVTDPIPPGTTYRPGTLLLNDTLLSDTLDADRGDVGGQAAGTITVALGDMTADTPVQRISFQVDLE